MNVAANERPGNLKASKHETAAREAGPLVPDGGVSVIVPAELLDGLATARHPAGPDAAARELRLTLWLALMEARQGRRGGVHASSADIARAFLGAHLGGMERPGMGERSLERCRAAWVERACVDLGRGRLRLKTRAELGARAFYGWDPAVVERVIYWCSNAALRVFCASAKPMAGAQAHGRESIVVRSRAGSGRSKQGRAQWCDGMRELRILGLQEDNRPGAQKPEVRFAEDGTKVYRKPARVVKVSSLLTPAARDRLVWTGDTIKPVKPEPEQSSGQGSESSTPRETGKQPAERERAGEGGAFGAVGLDGARSETRAVSEQSSQVQRQSSGRGAKITTGETRRILRESGVRGADDAADGTVKAIADAVRTEDVLRRVLAVEARTLATYAVQPVKYLAGVCRGEGAKIRRPGWAGSYATRDAHRPAEVEAAATGAGMSSAEELRARAAVARCEGWSGADLAAELEARALELEAAAQAAAVREAQALHRAARWAGVDREDARWAAALVEVEGVSEPAVGGRLADYRGSIFGRRVSRGWELVAEPWVDEDAVGVWWGRAIASALEAPLLCAGVVYEPVEVRPVEVRPVEVRPVEVKRRGSLSGELAALASRLRRRGGV